MDRWIVILIFGQFAFLGFVLWLIARAREARLRRRSEERTRLMERFSSGQELTDFLNSPAGARFLDVLRVEPAHPVRSLSGAVTAGIISFFAGSAFMIVSQMVPAMDRQGFFIPGVLGLMAGLGILLSAWVSARLYRRAGLLSRKPQPDGEEP